MIKKTQSFVKLSLFFALVLSLSFYACQQEDELTAQKEINLEQSVFEKHSAAQSQFITATDQGGGVYLVTGEQGTIISINNSLVNTNGEKVRGDVQVELKEIYSAADMILNRKQTVAQFDGQNGILESGGELFIRITQNGEELSIDRDGKVEVLLPTSNTGEARDDMELFIGEEVGEQIIWHPTGEKIRVIEDASRNQSYYFMVVESALGWVNVDVLWAAGGDPVECIDVVVDCPELCQPNKTYVFMHVPGVNSGVELIDNGNGTYQFCGIVGEPVLPLGGVTVTFIIIVECEDGTLMVALVTAIINSGYHLEMVDCSAQYVQIHASDLEGYLQQLN